MKGSPLFRYFTHTACLLACRSLLLTALFSVSFWLVAPAADAARVLVVGDLHYPFVANIAADIHARLRSQSTEIETSNIKGRLETVVERENAQIVVALGSEALNEALRLPSDIAVVYGLVTLPPKVSRSNMTGVYMSTPVSEYLSTIRRYFPSIGKIAVVGTPAIIKALAVSPNPQLQIYQASSPVELASTVSRLGDSQAILILPDASLLTVSIMDTLYALSFRKNIPIFGISEGNVKQGGVMALVFDSKGVSSQLGEKAQAILNGDDASGIPASAPRKFNVYLNANTAKKMRLELPDDLLKRARKVYQ